MEIIKISEIKIDQRFRKTVGSISTLVESIKEIGLLHPIVVSEKNELIAGWRRIKAFELLNRTEIPCNRLNLADLRKGEVQENLVRKDFTTSEMVAVKRALEPEISAKAEEREKAGSPSSNLDKGRTDEKLGSFVGVGKDTLRKAQVIVEAAEKEPEKFGSLLQKVDNSQTSVDRAYRMVKRTKQREEMLNKNAISLIPEGKYRTIIVDPPWPVKKILREVRPNQEEELDYRTLDIEQIKELPIKQLAYDDGCHVYLWVTHKFLPTAFEIFKSWEVNYECLLTWVKNVGFTPYSWMYSTEHILFGRIGSLEVLEKGHRLDFTGKVREHSRKPDEFYELVRKVSPEPRIDLFSREKREGFFQWGNEPDRFNVLQRQNT